MVRERSRLAAGPGDSIATIDSSSANDQEPVAAPRRDVMSVEKRSALMARIQGRDTGPERTMREILQRLGVAYREHDRTLPGRPDFVLTEHRIVVLVDGDFWHGWRFEKWKHKLSPRWRHKIASNIRRDRRNRVALRAAGWIVVRVWEHQIERSGRQVRRRLRANLRRATLTCDLAESAGAATSRA